jgi:hypothetical protein
MPVDAVNPYGAISATTERDFNKLVVKLHIHYHKI